MGITFHCEHCGKKIEASDSAGGKWGRCPTCHNKVYVPDLSSDEELKLAPINEDDRAKQKQLMAETYKLTQDILLEREVPNSEADTAASASHMNDERLTESVIDYLRQLADGQLDEAQKTAELIAARGSRAVKILDKIALSEIPEPELGDIPPQVLSGLIRTLRTEIS